MYICLLSHLIISLVLSSWRVRFNIQSEFRDFYFSWWSMPGSSLMTWWLHLHLIGIRVLSWPPNARSWVSHLLEEDLLVVDHPDASLKGLCRAEQVHLLRIHSREDWWRASERPLSSLFPKDRLRKPSCILQSLKEHWALCLHCAKDHHYDLSTIFKVSS